MHYALLVAKQQMWFKIGRSRHCILNKRVDENIGSLKFFFMVANTTPQVLASAMMVISAQVIGTFRGAITEPRNVFF